MHNIYLFSFLLLLFSLSFSHKLSATVNDPVDDDADIVYLKKSCFVNSSEVLNCFDNLPDLINWTWGTRQPSAASPLLVEIGPGTFTGISTALIGTGNICKNNGYVTFRGAGIDKTTLLPHSSNQSAAYSVDNCTKIGFHDLTIDGGDATYAFFWTGGGDSVYSNFGLTGADIAWYDDGCNGQPAIHYFFNSTITAVSSGPSNTSAGYFTRCSETWFFNSEITANALTDTVTFASIFVESNTGDDAEVHVYGSVIRALAPPGATIDDLQAVIVSNSASEIHIHGTGIDVISESDSNVTALSSISGGRIHANEASYVLESNGGIKARIKEVNGSTPSTVRAPYLWENLSAPPDIISTQGSDMAITTDTSDDPHIVVYSENCPTSKWYDTTIEDCR